MKENKTVQAEIAQLVADLNRWNQAYFDQDEPLVSDRVYDSHLKRLIELEQLYPQYILADSPSQKIGASLQNKFSKVQHQQPMLSLDKAYSVAEISKFMNDISKKLPDQKLDYLIEPKIDGLSIALHYQRGQLVQALTRGDGQTGEDVTANVFGLINDIPVRINYLADLEVRGEIYISKTNFAQINAAEDFKYANPRNLASGTMRQLDQKIIKQRQLAAFIYDVVDFQKHQLASQKEVVLFLLEKNFPVFQDWQIVANNEEISAFIEKLEQTKNNLDYEIDGLVLKLNQIKHYQTIGYTSKFPKYAIAYKFDDEIVETTLEDIFITIGRTGIVTYNARFKSVLLKGTMVSAATLHNYNYIEELNLNLNDEIKIKKAGEIIPKVIGVVRKKSTGIFAKILVCPACKNDLIDTKTLNNQLCINEDCPEINIRKIIHFASRQALNIEGLAEGIVRRFYELNFVRKINDIFTLGKFQKEIIEQKGFGKQFWNNLWNGIEQARKNITLDKLIFAIGIPQLGLKSAKLIAQAVQQFSNLLHFDCQSLLNIKDIGPITISEMQKYLDHPVNQELIKNLVNLGINPKAEAVKPTTTNFFAGKTFVISGTFAKTRQEIMQIIEALGGQFSSSVSKNTFALLKGLSPGSKLDKALKLGIRIIEEAELETLLEQI